ncbi:MAG: DNA repair protein RecN [Alphaproteobacteria bacterium]|nr:DNA repair protein RecN [Alphaproteobacteria bacterium]
MLTSIDIKNFILIESLHLSLGHKMSVLTGETGAGKSILLDAVAFALGAKADAKIIQTKAEQATVALSFNLKPDHPARAILAEHEIPADTELDFRRTISRDGKGKIFINDIPVSAQVAAAIGETLVEIHGQFDNQALLNAAKHLEILDKYAGNAKLLEKTAAAYAKLSAAEGELETMRADFAKARADEDYLRYNFDELQTLAPIRAGEESELDSTRRNLMQNEKASAAISDALSKLGHSPDKPLADAAAQLARVKDNAKIKSIIENLEAAETLINDAHAALEKLAPANDTRTLEETEARLFKLRELARKHRTTPDELPALLKNMKDTLANISNSDETLKKKEAEVEKLRAAFTRIAEDLSAARKKSALDLSAKVMAELAPLKLAAATFTVDISPAKPSARGIDSAAFTGATNFGGKPAPLAKIASGGEMSRFMLALKVVLLVSSYPITMIFDEVDTGISGATSNAVGERLSKLGTKMQTLVITHSPQVASFGDSHFKVIKTADTENKKTITEVMHLDAKTRVREIARIISNEKITAEALAAAEKLLKH